MLLEAFLVWLIAATVIAVFLFRRTLDLEGAIMVGDIPYVIGTALILGLIVAVVYIFAIKVVSYV